MVKVDNCFQVHELAGKYTTTRCDDAFQFLCVMDGQVLRGCNRKQIAEYLSGIVRAYIKGVYMLYGSPYMLRVSMGKSPLKGPAACLILEGIKCKIGNEISILFPAKVVLCLFRGVPKTSLPYETPDVSGLCQRYVRYSLLYLDLLRNVGCDY